MSHGHVKPNADGSKARCGGPGICAECSQELASTNTKAAAHPPRVWIDAEELERALLACDLGDSRRVLIWIYPHVDRKKTGEMIAFISDKEHTAAVAELERKLSIAVEALEIYENATIDIFDICGQLSAIGRPAREALAKIKEGEK